MTEIENMTEKELAIKFLEEVILFLSCKNRMEKFCCTVTDVPESEFEDFDKKWNAINKSGKSYIGKVELILNPNGPDEIGMIYSRRLHLHICGEDYIEWAKKEVERLKQVKDE